MRTYTVLYGKWKGQNYIFDSPDEASIMLSTDLKHLNVTDQKVTPAWHKVNGVFQSIFPQWHTVADPKVDIGRWVQTDDGRILQCWAVYYGSNNGKKTFKNGKSCLTKMVKTCIGVYYEYPRAEHAPMRSTMFADNKSHYEGEHRYNKHSMTRHKSYLGTKMNNAKRMFAYYLYITGDPVKSYMQVRPRRVNRLTKASMITSAYKLLQDPGIINELNKYLPSMEQELGFRKRLLSACEKEGLNEELLAKHISKGLKANIECEYDENGDEIPNKKTGGMGHKSFLELAINAVKFARGEGDNVAEDKAGVGKGKSNKEIQDVQFEEQPLLPPSKEIQEKVNKGFINENSRPISVPIDVNPSSTKPDSTL